MNLDIATKLYNQICKSDAGVRLEIVLDPVSEDGSIKYWRSADKVHHVPKRSLEDIIL